MKQKKRVLRLRTIIGSTCLLLILMVVPAQAIPLNLLLVDFPHITSGFIDVTYDAGTEQFVASGFALTLADGSGPPEIISFTSPNYNITSKIDALGIAISGTLTITGTVGSFMSGTLLTGDLFAFGFRPEGGDPLEFLFDVTGGDLAPSFGPIVGTILGGTNFGGSFAANFDNLINGIPGTGLGVNNTAPIPEPGTLSLMLLGSGAFLAFLRKRRTTKIS